MIFPILYSRASTGAIQQWQIHVEGSTFWTEAGQVGGAITASKPTSCKSKNIGKKNETSPEQQAEIEAEAKFVKKKKENYFENVADIDSGFLEPQLAKPCKEYLDDVVWSDGQVLDDKLNGFACVIVSKGAFTRTNEQYHAVPHILDEIKHLLLSNPDAYIQGELFNPEYVNDLGKISELISVVRQPKDITPELLEESKKMVEFHWYDGYGFAGITKDTPLLLRRKKIDSYIKAAGFKHIKPVHYDIVYSLNEAKVKMKEYVDRGGEGKIIKNPNAVYQHKRTKDLLKLKKQESAEFRVVDDKNPFEEGSGNSEGCAESVWVENPRGTRDKRCKINIEGPKDRLREMFKNPSKYRGQWITVRFQEYSPYNVPLIPYTDMVLREQVEGFKIEEDRSNSVNTTNVDFLQ